MFSILYTIMVSVITISSLIIVHECGHFYTARFFNTYIECFSLGFGKKIFEYRDKYGTNYILRLIPLGGYVKIPDFIEKDTIKYNFKKYKFLFFNQLNFLKKILIILGGPLANIIFAILIYWIIFFIGFPIKKTIINEINYISIANNIGLKSNLEIKKINNVNISNWNIFNIELIKSINNNRKINLEINKIDSNIIIKKTLNIYKKSIKFLKEKNLIFILGIIPKGLKINPIISYVIPGSIAEKLRLHIGDKIINIEKKKFTNWYNFQKFLYQNNNKIIHFNINRNRKKINFSILPIIIKSKNRNFLGFLPEITNVKNTSKIICKYNFFEALKKSLNKNLNLIKIILNSFINFFYNKKNIYKLNGPISIGYIAGKLIRNNFIYYFMFLALININLSIINLFPFPILDGGQLILLFFEKITGKKLSYKIKQLIYNISMIILIIIMGIALINDVKQI
ncbi:RIP metalloprotease RseP [Enterobacteriaceae endosymbiont of Donacia clavipes]|uniref:RIP metalloprotease RseP n=1 Tax=Enterobacteriaceae endosymbiont of Donacia clavipes TaxID=2675775 RepID=UPI001448E58D|nr:RIP metalloprotease RseP [Enterobacteriaceae endosymbiont of Donacia clavipes]QJC33302.1 RIP metalloprotease RseP [Enterobacteriaceae endosymbiont of Donacia clavipes]